MRILHVIESLGVGGAELALATLLGALQRQGHTVAVAVMRPPLDGVDALAAQGIHTHCLPARAQWNLPGRARDLARMATTFARTSGRHVRSGRRPPVIRLRP